MEKLVDFLNTISYRNYTFQKPEFEIKLKRPIFTESPARKHHIHVW